MWKEDNPFKSLSRYLQKIPHVFLPFLYTLSSSTRNKMVYISERLNFQPIYTKTFLLNHDFFSNVSYMLHVAILKFHENSLRAFKYSFFLSFLRFFFKISFHISEIKNGNSAGAYSMLCVTRTFSADSLNWIEKRGYGKDTSAMAHHADRYSCRASRKLLCTGNTSFISRSISVSQLLGVNQFVLFLRLLFDIQRISSRIRKK